MPRKKSKPAPLSVSGWISVLTAVLFALVICIGIVLAFLPVQRSATFGGRLANTATALAAQLHESDYRGFWVPLFIVAVVGFVGMGAVAAARRRSGPVGFGRAMAHGIGDAVMGLAVQMLDLIGGGSAGSRTSSSGDGRSGGGGAFGGGGASGSW